MISEVIIKRDRFKLHTQIRRSSINGEAIAPDQI
jgi:hypothetical protein